MSTNEVVVDRFIAALVAKDLDLAVTMVTDDIEYDNVPMRKVFGVDGLRSVLTGFLARCSAIDWVVLHQVASGDVVMNERIDRFETGDRWIELPVAGLFVLRDGRIALWRDYFDKATYVNAMAG